MDKVRAEVDGARLQRKKEQEEQMNILNEMGKIRFDKNDYENAIGTLARGMDNLSKLYQNWVRLQVFFGTVENFINAKVVSSVKDVNKWYKAVIINGEMKIKRTSFIENEIKKTTNKVIQLK